MKIALPIFLFVLFLFISIPSYAATATSNCVVTNVGNPGSATLPPECQGGAVAKKAIELARQQIGKPYIWAAPSRNWSALDPNAGKTPGAFDCSGLTGWAWYWASNGKISMNGQTWEDWKDNSGNGTTKYLKFTASQKNELQPGDLLYWKAPGLTSSDVHHTAIYSGQCKQSSGTDCFIEAKGTAWGIVESHLSSRLGGNDPLAGFLRPVLQ